MKQSLISIIIVTYNNEDVIKGCLEALQRQKYNNYEVIIVDNASKDCTREIVSQYCWVKLIYSSQNLGFTGGNKLGLKYAQGRYIALLNPDTEPSPKWLAALAENMDKHGNVGVCASKLIVHDSELIDSAGDGCLTTGRGFKLGDGENSKLFNESAYVFGACGGAMLIRRKLIDKIGFLDDDFFLIHEDTDFCFRAQLTGWKCLFVAEAIVYHKVRSSIGHMSDIAVYYSVRNSKLVWLKNMPLYLIIKYLPHHIIQECGSFCYFCIRHKKWTVYWQANRDFLKLVPQMLEKRKVIKKITAITTAEVEKILTSMIEPQIIKKKLAKFWY